MCGIAGINGNNISEKLYNMLISMKHRGPDGSGVFVDNSVIFGDLDKLDVPEGSFGLGHNLLSIVGCQGSQPLTHDKLVLVCNGEIYNYNKLKKGFEDDFKSDSDSEIVLMLIKQFYKDSIYEAVLKTVEYLDGDYAFAVYDGKDFAAVRDPLGVKTLYFGENKDQNIFAFASERKALWNIGINDVQTLSPTSMIYNKKIIKFNNKISEIITTNSDNSVNHYLSKDELKKQLKTNLIASVKKRVKGLSEVGILFSGGIDSTIIAKIVLDLGIKTTLYSVGHEKAIDLKFSKETALKLNLPIKIKTVDIKDVKNYLNPVLYAIEEFNLMKIGVGMPAYIAAEMAHEDGLKVMLSGQGADELFGGYNRYLRIYNEKGTIKNEDLWDDILNLYHVNLQRDDAVTMANSIELRVPYLDLDIINTAMNIPMKYKINGKDDNLRKCILREVGTELGVHAEIVKRPKKAAQYGSGIHKMLKKILKEDQFKNLPDKFNKHYIVN
ncbi:MAG: asparagine synthase (glutamine-hydrolyzing) [Methanobacterium sp.]|uniref:asparagine synthase (glutamine-hydrolyzing) n=1 Tax=Methanobacterium sp. TaxID=2164 RepID=UPI003D6617C7|nr:asparagine synthase (glutamine-hydrolyzing) [Methanobacterium sp.]